ncbi:MAG: metallophosphoesterase [bacterium]
MVALIKFFYRPFLDLYLEIYHHPLVLLVILLVFILISMLILCWQKKLASGIGKGILRFISIIIFVATFIFLFTYSIVIYSIYIEPNWIKVEKVTIKNTLLANAFEGITAIQITDLHIEEFGYREKKMIKLLNKLKPDILFITGDFITYPEGTELCLEVLKNINAQYGIWGIVGDRDGGSGNLKERMKKINITILTNEVKKLNLGNNPPFWLIGINGDNIPDEIKDVRTKVSRAPQLPIILLVHYPEALIPASDARIDLVLSGDTHGGQIGPLFLRKYWRRLRGVGGGSHEFIAGLYKMGATQLYISRGVGIGTHHIPVRFLCHPEITMFKFEKN